jgi:hypothetical protein
MRVYPNRMSKGNWIATLTANSAQDSVSIATRMRPPNGTARTHTRKSASAVPAAAVVRKTVIAQA